jgi:hypothetical protein
LTAVAACGILALALRDIQTGGRVGYYPNEIDGGVVIGAIERGEAFVIQAGRPTVVEVLALPLNKWRGSAAVTEKYDLQKAPRIGLSDLTAGLIIQIVAQQVDANWKPKAHAILTYSGRDALLLVPSNDYWVSLVGKEGASDRDAS